MLEGSSRRQASQFHVYGTNPAHQCLSDRPLLRSLTTGPAIVVEAYDNVQLLYHHHACIGGLMSGENMTSLQVINLHRILPLSHQCAQCIISFSDKQPSIPQAPATDKTPQTSPPRGFLLLVLRQCTKLWWRANAFKQLDQPCIVLMCSKLLAKHRETDARAISVQLAGGNLNDLHHPSQTVENNHTRMFRLQSQGPDRYCASPHHMRHLDVTRPLRAPVFHVRRSTQTRKYTS